MESCGADDDFCLDLLQEALDDENVDPFHLTYSVLENITNGFCSDQLIGQGGFGSVYWGKLKNGTMVAVKKLHNTINMIPILETNFKKEIACLTMVKHKNIVRCLGYCAETQTFLAVYQNGRRQVQVQAEVWHRLFCLEYVSNGNLSNYISEFTGPSSSGHEWSVRYQIIKGICQGVGYLHGEDIIHMDLKPQNILLDDDMVPKIADFGLSRRFTPDQSKIITKTIVGSWPYMAPEFLDSGIITFKTDIYSLGVIIIEILMGCKQFPIDDEVLGSWLSTSEIWESHSVQEVKLCAHIGKACTDKNPSNRPGIQLIIDWLDSLDSSNSSATSTPMIGGMTGGSGFPGGMGQDMGQMGGTPMGQHQHMGGSDNGMQMQPGGKDAKIGGKDAKMVMPQRTPQQNQQLMQIMGPKFVREFEDDNFNEDDKDEFDDEDDDIDEDNKHEFKEDDIDEDDKDKFADEDDKDEDNPKMTMQPGQSMMMMPPSMTGGAGFPGGMGQDTGQMGGTPMGRHHHPQHQHMDRGGNGIQMQPCGGGAVHGMKLPPKGQQPKGGGGGGGGGKDARMMLPQPPQQMQQLMMQMKGMKLPPDFLMSMAGGGGKMPPAPAPAGKDPKAVKFSYPDEDELGDDGSEFDDEFDDEDEFEDDGFDGDPKMAMKPVAMPPAAANGGDKKGGKKGGGGGNEIPVQMKGNGQNNGGGGGGGGDKDSGGKQNQGGGGGGGKNGGGSQPPQQNGKGGGNGNQQGQQGKKGGCGGGGGGQPAGLGAPMMGSGMGMPPPAQHQQQPGQGMMMRPPSMMGGGGFLGGMGQGMGGQMGGAPMGHHPHQHMGGGGNGMQMMQPGGGGAVHGMPAGGGGMPGAAGFYQGGGGGGGGMPSGAPPEMMQAAGNPMAQQQQYMAMMQQQMNGHGGWYSAIPPTGYPRSPPRHWPPQEYMFSDENANASCMVM